MAGREGLGDVVRPVLRRDRRGIVVALQETYQAADIVARSGNVAA